MVIQFIYVMCSCILSDELTTSQTNKMSFCPLDKWFEKILKNKFIPNVSNNLASRIKKLVVHLAMSVFD